MVNSTQHPRVYLAGPEVFLPNAKEIGRLKQEICEASGLEGVFPLDTQLDLAGLPKAEQARRIALGNEGLMRSCEAIIANLTPFRGVSMDSGTAFEVGFMRALGRPVFGYTNAGFADYAERAREWRKLPRRAFDCDRPEQEIEDFGLAENLMIAVAVSETAGGVEAVEGAADAVMAEIAAFKRCVTRAAAVLSTSPQ
jgi:nucleoside 2-deoxyribosyltransferase